jgi:hypothetical protein
MKLENSLGLPEPIVNAIRNDEYNKGESDYSVTGLIRPVRIASLSRKWDAQLSQDVSDMIFTLFGRSIHTILERAGTDEYLTEQRFFSDFGDKPWVVSGQIDVYHKPTKVLSNYKICSRWVVADGFKPEWQAQASMEALLMRRNGYEVKRSQVVAIFRDWSKMAAARKTDYPDKQVTILPIPLWDDAKTETYIKNRIIAHELGRENPPVCTEAERWTKPRKFALMKKGQKRAVKLFEREAEALERADRPSLYVVERPGEETRCLFYCGVSQYCDFGREVIREAAGQ